MTGCIFWTEPVCQVTAALWIDPGPENKSPASTHRRPLCWPPRWVWTIWPQTISADRQSCRTTAPVRGVKNTLPWRRPPTPKGADPIRRWPTRCSRNWKRYEWFARTFIQLNIYSPFPQLQFMLGLYFAALIQFDIVAVTRDIHGVECEPDSLLRR